MTYQEAILKNIEISDGIGERDLLLKVMGIINPSVFDKKEFYSSLLRLRDSGLIIELTARIPVFDEPKVFYFSKGTEISCKKCGALQ